MKILKTLSIMALLASFAGVANAAPTPLVFRITGSTAYRGATTNAISNIFDGGAFTMAYSGTSGPTGATYTVFSGTCTLSGTAYALTVCSAWSGSEAGVQAVSAVSGTLNHVNFLATSTSTTTGTAAGNNNTINVTGGIPNIGNGADSQIPDACMCDTYLTTSQFNGVYKSGTYTAPTESVNSPVGVNPFVFIAGGGTAATPSFSGTNITSSLARKLYTSGTLPLSMFTGNFADVGSKVYALGRDGDSGTRLTAFAVTGFGALSLPKQYEPNTLISGTQTLVTSGTSQGIDQLVLWPQSTVDHVVFNTGNGGYSSGGQLSTAMASTFTSALPNSYTVAYLSTSDAKAAVVAGATNLAFNGVKLPFSGGYSDFTLLQNGQYAFWGYEHMFYNSAAGSPQQQVADAIAANLLSFTAVVPLTSMHVAISGDGGLISPQ